MKTIQDDGFPRLSVGKLIELLQKFDPEAPVAIRARNTDGEAETCLETYWKDFKYQTTNLNLYFEDVLIKDRSFITKVEKVLTIAALV